MSKKLTQEEFLERVKEVHCDTYRYDKTVVKGSKIPVTITCPIHGDFEQRPGDHLRGCGCPLCGIEKSRKAKRNTTEEFIEKAKKVHGNKYDYSKVEYIDKLTPVIIICPKHGEFTQTPDTHLNGSGCQKCGMEKSKKTAVSQKLTTEKFIEKARKIHGNKYDYSKVEYVNSHTPVKIICKIHGEFEQTPTNHLCGKGCPICSGKNMTTEQFIKKARIIHGDRYDYSKVVYINSTTKVCIICPEHGEFWQSPNNHLDGKGCYFCGVKQQTQQRTITTSEFIKRAMLIHNGKYKYDKVDYINARSKVCIICPSHGEFWQEPCLHLSGSGCPNCCCNISKEEKKIYDYICGLVGDENVIHNTIKLLKFGEIDIYIQNENIGIEFDGLYWHTESQGKDKSYHIKKTLEAQKLGIHLVHIFEDEWRNNELLVKDKISHMLHMDKDKIKIGARKCKIREISMLLAKPFLNKFHIQGWTSSSIYCGAFYDDKLVGVMSFLEEYKGMWNLVRFSTDINYSIPGLASKIFSYFVKEHNNDIIEIKTFLDKRWSWTDINVYDRMGFRMVEEIRPSYYYVKNNKRYHKFGFRKQILNKKYGLPMTMTESEMTKTLGYEKIWDCGLYKYVWRNSQQN